MDNEQWGWEWRRFNLMVNEKARPQAVACFCVQPVICLKCMQTWIGSWSSCCCHVFLFVTAHPSTVGTVDLYDSNHQCWTFMNSKCNNI